MLTIRKAQMDAMASEMAVGFEERMAAYLQGAFSAWCAGMGRAKLREFVRHGMRRAEEYGFQVELDAARYLLAMRELGMEFDESAEHGWAKVLLTKRMAAGAKMERLEDGVVYQREARRIRDGR
ncbi:MAG: hypothetical protein ACKV2U_02855 [Bryobacteraceae bacterium]